MDSANRYCATTVKLRGKEHCLLRCLQIDNWQFLVLIGYAETHFQAHACCCCYCSQFRTQRGLASEPVAELFAPHEALDNGSRVSWVRRCWWWWRLLSVAACVVVVLGSSSSTTTTTTPSCKVNGPTQLVPPANALLVMLGIAILLYATRWRCRLWRK